MSKEQNKFVKFSNLGISFIQTAKAWQVRKLSLSLSSYSSQIRAYQELKFDNTFEIIS